MNPDGNIPTFPLVSVVENVADGIPVLVIDVDVAKSDLVEMIPIDA